MSVWTCVCENGRGRCHIAYYIAWFIFRLRMNSTSLVPRPSHCPVFVYCKWPKTGWWEGLGTRLEFNSSTVFWFIIIRHLPLLFRCHSDSTHISPQEMLYSQMASTKTKEESDVLSDTISKCSLCLLPKDVTIPPSLSLDGREEEYHLPLLFHQGQSYHATCANFWCNAVLEELPVPRNTSL